MRRTVISVCLLSLWIVQVLSSDNERPVVDTPSGQYRGHILKTRNGRDVLAFQGIPYALPPIGELRFKEPVKMPKSNNILDANDESKECYQPVFDMAVLKTQSEFRGDEDCLYLNIYQPMISKNNEKLPVYFWIHGGGYFMASRSSFYNGPEFLLDQNIILVTINYRLGILGFLSTGDKILPGNLGMKDQVMALKWVHENIAAFGGDPQSITIGGQSAGGASVIQHIHSNLSKGLFHKGIAHSGSMDCVWAMKSRRDARHLAKKFGHQVKCPLEQDDFIECLQKRSVKDLFQSANEIKDSMGIMSMDFVPVIEEESPTAFLTASSVQSPSDIPLMIGITNYECVNTHKILSSHNVKYKEISGILDDQEKLFPKINYYSNHPDASEITRRLVQFYFKDDQMKSDQLLSLINLSGDIMFNYGVNIRARKHKGPTYLYMFSYKGAFISSPQEHEEYYKQGVSHSEDLLYMFDFKFIPHEEMIGKDLLMSQSLVKILYDFIKTGDPTPSSKIWEESDGGVNYLDFTNDGLRMKSNMFQSRIQFLDQLNINLENFKHDEL